MSLSADKVFVGVQRRLDGTGKAAGSWPAAYVTVTYTDEQNVTHKENLCPDGARLLSKALKANADFLDPPKKPRGRKPSQL